MNVISRPAIDEAIVRHPDAESWLNAWWKVARREQIAGVRYATVARGRTLFVKHFLTHPGYDTDVWKNDCGYER